MREKMSDLVQLTAAGGIVYKIEKDEYKILLILRNGVWDLPKGKLEEGESIPGCAIREVAEEVGLVSDPDLIANLGTTVHTYSQNGVEFEKETYWFVMTLSEDQEMFTPQKSEGISRIEWVSAAKSEELAGYQNMKVLIKRFRTHLKSDFDL